MDVMMKNISTANLLAAAFNGGVKKPSNFPAFRFSESPNNGLKFTSLPPTVSLLRPISSATQALEEAVVSEVQSGGQSKTAHVKIVLQKQCLFGEQLFLTGDDPMLGLWDPLKAVPMSWSDDHVWAAELDIPVDSSIQFKVMLRGLSGEFRWQPGPDRIIRMWDTSKTIIVSEDWENAELQKISEEELFISSSKESSVTADVKSSDNKQKPLKNEGAGMLVSGFAPNALSKSTSHVVTGRPSNALHASDVAKDCNSSQLYSEQEDAEAHLQKDETEPSNNNMLAKETVSFSDNSGIQNSRGTVTDGISYQNGLDYQSTADIVGNHISWGFKALNQLLLILGFTMNASAD